jgi:hypothetical protein
VQWLVSGGNAALGIGCPGTALQQQKPIQTPLTDLYLSKPSLPRFRSRGIAGDSQESIEICFFKAWLLNPGSAHSWRILIQLT